MKTANSTCKKTISALLIIGMLFSFAMPVMAESDLYGKDNLEHTDLDFKDIVYDGYNIENFDEAIEALYEASSVEGNEEEVIECYDHIVHEYDVLSTQYELNALRYFNDVNNEEYEIIDSELNEMAIYVYDEIFKAARDTLKNPLYSKALEDHINNPELAEDFLGYVDMTDMQKELVKEENALVQEYNKASGKEYVVEVDGKTWNEEALYSDETLDYDTYVSIQIELTKAKNAECAEIYLKLVKVRNELAKTYGYDNYADYAYTDIYCRDYTTEEAKNLYKEVKTYFVPLQSRLEELSYYYSIGDELYDMRDLSGEQLVDMVEPYVSKISPELTESYEYLKNKHAYDLDYSDTKMPIGYTVVLRQYGMPFIFNAPNGTYIDIKDFIHEYGHYNEEYHNSTFMIADASTLDVSEIHSQGMELLFLEYADDLYGKDNGNAVRMNNLYYIVESVTQGCLYDEFQNEVYKSEEDLTVRDLNRIFRRLGEEYGLHYMNDDDEAYGWISVTHTFQSPMYYISYATSALSALDIFGMTVENRQAAIDCYMNLTTYEHDVPYREVISDVGLQDIFEPGTLETISAEVQMYIDDIEAKDRTEATYRRIVYVAVAVIVIAFVTILVVWFVGKRKEKQAAAQDEEQKDIE